VQGLRRSFQFADALLDFRQRRPQYHQTLQQQHSEQRHRQAEVQPIGARLPCLGLLFVLKHDVVHGPQIQRLVSQDSLHLR
jgi:hypothetical protein